MDNVTGKIHSFETLGAVDGPGLRFVLFLQGCHLRCLYCHNPDTWCSENAYTKTVTAEEIAREVLKYRNYYGKTGGITVSGGEPLLQLDFLIALFRILKAEGIHTAIDTSGAEYSPDEKRYDELLSLTDLVLLDIKHIDNDACRCLTGRGNRETLAFAGRLSEEGISLWVRQVLVPGYTDGEENLRRTREWLDTLSTVERVEVLPYHTLGRAKYDQLGIPYRLDGVPAPSAEEVRRAEEILCRDEAH